jgi:dTDP-4-dehydrorhamnose 3,5-epimerase-like enzyme
MVSNIPKGSIGAREVHKVRHELAFVLDGSVRWTCEDVYGNVKECILDKTTAIWTPPYVLHTYEALEENSRILVIANTLFDPNDPRTHDSYSETEFRELQAEYASHP